MQKTYDREFKLKAVRMTSEPGVSAKDVEKRLGIGQEGSFPMKAATICQWE